MYFRYGVRQRRDGYMLILVRLLINLLCTRQDGVRSLVLILSISTDVVPR